MYVQDSFIYYITQSYTKKIYGRFELNPIMPKEKSHFKILKCGYDWRCTVHDMSADIPFEY